MNNTNFNILPFEKNKTYFNIIFAVASIPPVIASMISIKSNYKTYAIIQRGKTYQGINNIENFYNAGFDSDINMIDNFHQHHLDNMVQKISELKNENTDAFFNIFVQDATVSLGIAVAANAKLNKDQFHIYMIEDGIGTYNLFINNYTNIGYKELIPLIYQKKYKNPLKAKKHADFMQKESIYNRILSVTKRKYFSEKLTDYIYDMLFPPKKLSSLRDTYLFDYFMLKVSQAGNLFDSIMSNTNNKVSDNMLKFDFSLAPPLSTFDNFTFIIQDIDRFNNIVSETHNKNFTDIFLSAQSCSQRKANICNIQIDDLFFSMSEAEQKKYLTLIFGNSYNDVYNTLTRTTVHNHPVPLKKLIYFQQQFISQPKFISDSSYGIGGLNKNDKLPLEYSDLDKKYKNILMFGNKEDFDIFIEFLTDKKFYPEGMSDKTIQRVYVEVFNRYINYIFQLKLMYKLYGNSFDFILKGHPAEPMGSPESWNHELYNIKKDGEVIYNYIDVLDHVICGFHLHDSTGKYIGHIPYTISSENIAYLNTDFSLGGHPSSSYTGFGCDTDIIFIISSDHGNIKDSINLNKYSTISNIYDNNSLNYTDDSGNKVASTYYNIGNTYKAAASVLTQYGDFDSALVYSNLYRKWLTEHRNNAADIDNFGFAVR